MTNATILPPPAPTAPVSIAQFRAFEVSQTIDTAARWIMFSTMTETVRPPRAQVAS